MAKGRKQTFEEALARLEEIVALMESENCSLDEALARYEEGVTLVKFCGATLDEAEKKIEILTRGSGDSVETRPFSPGGGEKNPEGRPVRRRGGGAGNKKDGLLF